LPEPAAVACLSGSRYADRPLAFAWQGQRLRVAALLTRWRSPIGPGFRVRSEDGRIFDLTYNERKDAWQMVQP
jgi:hypothetical protein